jgi:crotonobetainyl-CoA:carnitine CoA-transferase CaiB-like acyl-CoA transferase
VILAVGNDGQFAKFCQVAGRPELATDPRFARNQDRVRNRAVLVPLLEAIMKTRGKPSGCRRWKPPRCRAARSTTWPKCSPTRTCARGMVHVGAPAGRPGAAGGQPAQAQRTPVRTDLPPPLLGQHTDEVLARCSAGTQERIAALRRKEVI